MTSPLVKGLCTLSIKDIPELLFAPTNEIKNLILDGAAKKHELFKSNQITIQEFESLPDFCVYEISGTQYLIEKNSDTIAIANYENIKKRLNRLNKLLGNHHAAQKINIKVKNEVTKNAEEANIHGIPNIIDSIDGIFSQVHKYHLPSNFDPKWQGEFSNFGVLISTNYEMFWFGSIQEDYIQHWNDLFLGLRQLFNTITAKEFYDIRNFILLELGKIKIDLANNGFYFINSPFQDDIKNLGEKINNGFSDKKIKLKNKLGNSKSIGINDSLAIPKSFDQLFCNPTDAEPCLNILRELDPQIIDSGNNYIGKAKGIFPLWIKVLKTNRPAPLIKHFADKVYKDVLNAKINGLNLSKDASEFRKTYKRLESNNIELDIKTILSQYSHNGKLGK